MAPYHSATLRATGGDGIDATVGRSLASAHVLSLALLMGSGGTLWSRPALRDVG